MSTSVSSVVSHFPSAENGFTTTTSGSVSSGAATVGLNSVAGYTNGEIVVFVIDPTDASKKQTFTGTMDTGGSQVTSVVWTAGTNQTHSAGATIVDYATATHISMMSKGLLVEHAQTGLHTLTSSATITSSKVITGLNDTNGNEIFKVGATGSAVNEFTLTNAATGNAPILSSTGDNTNIGLTLTPKGTGNVSMTSRADGWVTGLTAPTTVTANGGRFYDVVVNSTDYTDRLSPGQKLRLTRTVTAPTQCTDLEASSSHYFTKTSPNKLTFTDDFTCMGWVKLESYTAGGIIARRNADTEGWSLSVNATGQVALGAYRIAGNNAVALSYGSLPLNRWVHVAASYDLSGTTAAIYFDGVSQDLLKTVTGTCTALVQGTTALVVGAEKSAGTNPFDGKIAQAAVFNAVISAATVRSYMSQGLAGNETSLQSAYSFSNSIVDLNTTTPNDLSAVNSAVATATDTPFSGGATGTTEYALIMSVAFSTNTTITCYVPDGYAIPTSGGVSALAYSTHSSPFGYPNNDRIIGYAQITNNFTTTSATAVQVTGLSCPVTIPANSKVKITAYTLGLSNSSGTNTAEMSIWDGTVPSGTRLQVADVTAAGAGATGSPATLVAIVSPSATSKTYNIGSLATSGTTTVSATATSPTFIMVELV